MGNHEVSPVVRRRFYGIWDGFDVVGDCSRNLEPGLSWVLSGSRSNLMTDILITLIQDWGEIEQDGAAVDDHTCQERGPCWSFLMFA